MDSFEGNRIEGWFVMTGDGAAEMEFVQHDGYATMHIDATKDRYNVYWTLIKRDVTSFLDLNRLKDQAYQLRVEARVRVHNAPRRLNFMVNTQRTTDFHKDLMEFDIPDTVNWHVISMTTKKFDAVPGDTVYVQLAATDFGSGRYQVDIDYYKADIVDVHEAGSDKGVLVPYHPPVPDISSFVNHLDVAHDAVINLDFPGVNFGNWHVNDIKSEKRILTVSANQWAILRWDFSNLKNTTAEGPALLELTTQSFANGGEYVQAFGGEFGMEFGKVRVFEIHAGDASWDQHQVTFESFLQGKTLSEVVNEQMVFDTEIDEAPGSRNLITISQPVLQRLIDGTTKGLLIRPLGAVDASFYDSENLAGFGPKLHFNVKQ
ncbi:MAG: hypothetical protein JXA72_09095 [Bacteroidales bacterium]|nr:hypothetical protein [Bacteroidales bacterium]